MPSDRIADPWGERTPFAAGGPWPVRVDAFLEPGLAAEDVDAWQRLLESEGVAVESVVDWQGGARSLYFRDPDANLAELISPGFWSIY